MTPIIRVAAALVILFALSACQAMTGRTAGRNIDDLTITTSVKARLVADKLSNFTRIDVDTVNAVVSLNGLVESESRKTAGGRHRFVSRRRRENNQRPSGAESTSD